MANTQLSDLINPQVMADIISGKIDKAIVVTPYAKIDRTLVGVPGSTISVPRYSYIGDASDIAEGSSAVATKLTATMQAYEVKKAMKAINLSDEAVLSAFGNPVGEANTQLANAISAKVDLDNINALYEATALYEAGAAISYSGIVDAVDLFNEELNTEKVMFVNPKQVTKLRKDSDFTSADKYGQGTAVVMRGEIGMIANCHIVPSKRVQRLASYYKLDSTGSAVTSSNIETVRATLPGAKIGDKVSLVSTASYICPIVKIESDDRTEDDVAALTVYVKRETNVETERHTLSRDTDISVDKVYVCALTNDSKVVKAAFTA